VRVVHVTADLGVAGGGVAKAVLPLARAQLAAGADVRVLGTGAPLGEARGGPPLASFPRGWPVRLAVSPGLRRALASVQADVIHAHGVWLRPLGYAAAASRRSGVPLVVSPHGMLSPWALGRGRLRKWLAGRVVHPGAFDAVSAWHAASELEASELRQRLGRVRVCVAAHGVSPPPPDLEAGRRLDAAAAPGRRRLLFYSRFHHKKGVRELIRIFAALAPEHPDWDLWLVGLPESDDVASLRRRAARAGVGERVTVLDGRSCPAPWPLAELLALPSHSENFGLVVLEALAAGIPVITTTATPWSALERVGAGRCVPLSGFASALAGLMAEPPQRLAEAGARGREWALGEFDWGRSAGRLLDEYAALIAGARGPVLSTNAALGS
jgi:glycosyltransferase involved in cell wall biosynthesis